MSLKKELKKGDWVKATNVRTKGPEIIGQAAHDMDIFGYAQLKIILGNQWETTTINVNHWDVEPTQQNLLKED